MKGEYSERNNTVEKKKSMDACKIEKIVPWRYKEFMQGCFYHFLAHRV